ncbi:hypothetical protein [Candidatus Poriferisodalis sp.]|uniref:hypothetical protein n=1 Tax=Candidatus Poriferisodalis sp. TaxID=3101277 RepID=UPI003B01B8C6
MTDNPRNCYDATVVTWKAPDKKQDDYFWRRCTLHAVGCVDGWKEALPEWREPPAPAVRVTRTAASELGLSEGDHPRDEVVAALAQYEGGSRAVAKLRGQLEG